MGLDGASEILATARYLPGSNRSGVAPSETRPATGEPARNSSRNQIAQ